MADTTTTNLGLTKPEVGASTDSWGTKVNTDLDLIDALFDTGPLLKKTKGGTGTATPALVAGANIAVTNAWPNHTVAFSGTLPVASGGTGATSLTSNNIVIGNGTSAVQFVAPGTSGNVLTSNGTTWASTTLVAGGLTNVAVFTSSGTFTVPAGITKCKVTVTGGGGGAGNAYAGAAGGTAIGFVTVNGSTATITVGAGGAAGASGASGTSSFVYGATTVSATGGTSGNTGTSFSPTNGGTGTGGDINVTGGPGAAISGTTATGGASFWGGGDTWTGASAYGSGGGWYTNTGTVAGRSGIVVIEY